MSTITRPRPAPVPPAPPPPLRRSRLPWRSAEAKAVPRDNLASACLFLVTLAVALSLGRLFQGTTWPLYGLAAAALGHGLAWGLRRLGAGLTLASVSSALLSILVAVVLVVPQATTFGLPTPFTFEVLGQALVDAQTSFRNAVAPVAPSPGFVAAAVVGVCMCAFLADWAAFRMRTAFEACVPGLALFVFTAVLGAKSHRGLAVAGFAAACLVFLIVQRANLDGGQTAWFGGRDRGALPSLLGTGAILGAVALIGALVLSPMVPGATSKPVLSFKKGRGGAGTGTRSTVSPLVDIQSRLREYADTDVFTVKADRPAYWRLTSLDQFNGTIWSSNERYATSRGELPRPRDLRGAPLVQEVEVTGLASIWLPAAYSPTSVDGVSGLSYSPGSASLITKKDTTNGLRYTITSTVPEPTTDQLRRAPASASGTSGLGGDFRRYTELSGISNRVRAKAVELGRRGTNPYEKAIAIQDYLRSPPFKYSLDVPAGHSGNVIEAFLFRDQIGYCEQYAGSFAVLARLLGLPTRVAVGFQPGGASGGTFAVKDKDAHAWPEVYLEGIGWTAFEPTPSAGNPQAESYTGVPYEPAAPAAPEPETTPTTAGPPSQQPGIQEPDAQEEPASAEEVSSEQAGNPLSWIGRFLRRTAPLWITLVGLAVLAGLSAGFVAWERRRHRRLAGGSPEARVQTAWEESILALSLDGVRLRPAETVDEFLHRLRTPAGGAALAGVERGTPASDALLRLGHTVVASAYTGRQASPDMAAAAEADRDVIVAACRTSLGRRARLRADIDPRPALTRLRTSRATPRPTPNPFEAA